MNIVKACNLACPIDGERLESHDKQLLCRNGHVFDVARQGYVNLLPVQHKRSKQPGDSKEMIAARARFLNTGVYEPVATRLAEITFSQMEESQDICLLDAGCGEGYYFDTIFNEITAINGCTDITFIGLDISKAAIAESAKRNKQITWVVGTNRQPPVEPASVDIILCVFGFPSFEGFRKVLKPGGKVVLVEPGPDHLKELREIIYTEVIRTGPPDISYAEEMGFCVVDRQPLQFRTGVIGHGQIHDLLIMTPHFYRATKQRREAADRMQQLDLSVDVVFRTLEKK